MTQASNTLDRFDLSASGENVREMLSDMITNISPTETPFQSNIARGKATNTYNEWLQDSLADADTSNAAIDGDEFAGDAQTEPLRMGNYCQISTKSIVISRRAEIVRKAGRKSEIAYQVAKNGRALKRDVEAILLNKQAVTIGNATTAPTLAGLPSWLRDDNSNGTTDRGATGADPTLSSTTYGYPDAIPTDGTARALSEATLLGVIKATYIEGGNPSMIMVGPTVKQRFSNYMFGSSARIATQYQDQGKSPSGGVSAVGAVDVYVSDFGTLDIVPNRFQRERDVFVLDPEYWAVDYLDPYHVENKAETGDARKRFLVVDYTLRATQQLSSGIVADIDETAAMTA